MKKSKIQIKLKKEFGGGKSMQEIMRNFAKKENQQQQQLYGSIGPPLACILAVDDKDFPAKVLRFSFPVSQKT